MAAAAALLGFGWLGGWAMDGRSLSTLVAGGLPEFVQEARVEHVVYRPGRTPRCGGSCGSVKAPIEWLSRRLGSPLAVPDLFAQGYTLMGGRLVPGEQASGARVTLHVSAFGADALPASTSFRFASDDASSSLYWVDCRYGYALTGKLPRARLEVLANAAYAQLLMLRGAVLARERREICYGFSVKTFFNKGSDPV